MKEYEISSITDDKQFITSRLSLLLVVLLGWAFLVFPHVSIAQVLPVFSEDGRTVMVDGVGFEVDRLDENTLNQLKQRIEQQADFRNNAGVAALASDAHTAAIDHFKAALTLRPTFKQAKTNLVVAYIKVNKLDQAQKVFSELLQEYPDDVILWRQQATLFLMQNRIADAVTAYEEVAKRSDAAAAYVGIARSYMAIGKYNEALSALEEAQRSHSNDLNIRYELGNAHLSLQHYRKAFVAYDTIVKLQPKNYEALLQRGRTHFALNEYTAAIADFDRVLELRPNYVAAYNNRAATYSQVRNYGTALADLEKALELDTENGITWLNLGKVQYSIGREGEACKSWQKARELGRAESAVLLLESCKE